MLTSICIKSFRGLQDVEIAPLKRVNLIMGQNNTGKTGVLEALALLLSDSQFFGLPQLFRTPSKNDPNSDRFWEWLFRNKDMQSTIEIRGNTNEESEFRVAVQSGPHRAPADYYSHGARGPFNLYRTGKITPDRGVSIVSTHPTDPQQDAIDYNRVILKRKKKQVEKLLREIEPRLEAIESLQTGNEPLLYADIGLSEMIPITQMGQGFNRLLDIYSEIVAAESKVLLIDEIENGLHHSVLPTIWRGLFNAAEDVDVQIFATTHSWECVLAADQAAREESDYQLNLIRLDRVDGQVKATVIDQPALETAKELHWEMR